MPGRSGARPHSSALWPSSRGRSGRINWPQPCRTFVGLIDKECSPSCERRQEGLHVISVWGLRRHRAMHATWVIHVSGRGCLDSASGKGEPLYLGPTMGLRVLTSPARFGGSLKGLARDKEHATRDRRRDAACRQGRSVACLACAPCAWPLIAGDCNGTRRQCSVRGLGGTGRVVYPPQTRGATTACSLRSPRGKR